MSDIKVGDKVRYIGPSTEHDTTIERLVTTVDVDGDIVCITRGTLNSVRFHPSKLRRTHECLGWREVLQEPEWWPPQPFDYVRIAGVRYWHCDHDSDDPWRAEGGEWANDDEILALHHEHGSELLYRDGGDA